MPQDLTDSIIITQWLVDTGSGNGFVPSGTKPLPELMLIQIYEAIWSH